MKKIASLALVSMALAAIFMMSVSHKVKASPAVCTVPTVSYPTIQSAVDDPGCATINVAAGPHTENVVITRAVTLRGANVGTNGADPRGPETNVTSFFISSGDVVVDGFSFSNAGPQVQILNLSTVLSGVSIRNNVFSGYSGVGVLTNDAGNISITRNLFKTPIPNSEAIQINGLLAGACNGSVLGENVFTAASDDGGAEIYFICTATASRNVTVSGNTDTGLSNQTSFIAFSGVVDGIVVKNNKVTGTPTAGEPIFFFGGVTGAVDISKNVITGFPQGNGIDIGNFGDGPNSGNFTFNGNDLSQNFRSIRLRDAFDSGAVVTFHQNNLSGNLTHAGVRSSSSSFTASGQCNWWGSATGPTNAANPAGTGDASDGMITFRPWLLSPPPYGACGGGLSRKDCEKAVEQLKQDFDTQQEADKKAFDDQQNADKKAFDDQQKAEKQAFDLVAHTAAQKMAFNAQQAADKKAFDDNQKNAKKIFDDNQKDAKKVFEDQNKADRDTCKMLPENGGGGER